MKIILKCEQPAYNEFTGKELSIERTVTHEFVADALGEALENYEMFLRGVGYHFDGQLEIVEQVEEVDQWQDMSDEMEETASSVFNNMMNELVKNNTHIQPMSNSNAGRVIPGMVKMNPKEHCSLCGLSELVMRNHNCWDSKCPRNEQDLEV